MKKVTRILSQFTFIIFLFSCTSSPEKIKTEFGTPDTAAKTEEPRLAKNYLTDCKKLFSEARHMDSILMSQTEINLASANQAIKAFTDFAYYCQSDSMSPMFLIKTAQVARVTNNIPQAKLALTHCIDTYLTFKNRPAALFLLAQLYDEKMYLNDEKEAKKLYEQIINDYPDTDWALNARGALTFLGKTDEEIIKEFNKKQKKSKG
jgi:outer membrane protein assembly factor BamD (BamD/ComL family)